MVVYHCVSNFGVLDTQEIRVYEKIINFIIKPNSIRS